MNIKYNYNLKSRTENKGSLGNLLPDIHNLKNISYDRPEIELIHDNHSQDIYKQDPKPRSQSQPQMSISRQAIKQTNLIRLQQMREKIQGEQNQNFVKQYQQHIDNTQLYRYRILKDIQQKINDNGIEYREINQFLEQIQSMPIPTNEKMMYLNQIENMLYLYEQQPPQDSQAIIENIISSVHQQALQSIPVDMHIQSVDSLQQNNINSQASQSQQLKQKPKVQFQFCSESKHTQPDTSSLLFQSSGIPNKRPYRSDVSSDYEEILQPEQQTEIRPSASTISMYKSPDRSGVLSNYSRLIDKSISAQRKTSSYKQSGVLQNDLMSQLHIYKANQQQKQANIQDLIVQNRIDDKMEYLQEIDEHLNNSLRKNEERQNQIDRILNSLQCNKDNIVRRKNQPIDQQISTIKQEEKHFQQQDIKLEPQIKKQEIEKPQKQDVIPTIPLQSVINQQIPNKIIQSTSQVDKQIQASVQYQDKQTQCFLQKQQLFQTKTLDTIEECIQTEMNGNLLSSNIQQPKQVQSNLFMSQLSANQPLQNSLFTQNNYDESLSSLMKEEQTKLEQQSLNEQISRSVVQQQSQQLQQKKLKDQIDAELKMQELRENLHEQSFVTKQEEEKTQKLQQFQSNLKYFKQNQLKNNNITKKAPQLNKNNLQISQFVKQSPSLLSSEKKVISKPNIIKNVQEPTKVTKPTQYAVKSKPFKSASPHIPAKSTSSASQYRQQSMKKPTPTVKITTMTQVKPTTQKQQTQLKTASLQCPEPAKLAKSPKPPSVSQKPQEKPKTQTKSDSPSHVDINLQLISSEYTPRPQPRPRPYTSSNSVNTPQQHRSNVFTKSQHQLSTSQPLQSAVSTSQPIGWQSSVISQKKRVATMVFE